MNDIKMLYFNRTDIFEGIDVNETSASKAWDLSLLVLFKQKV